MRALDQDGGKPLTTLKRLHYSAALMVVMAIPLIIGITVAAPSLVDQLAMHMPWVGLILFVLGYLLAPTVARHVKP